MQSLVFNHTNKRGAVDELGERAGPCAMVVGDRGLEPHPGPQISKKQNVSSPLIRKDLILWGASMTER